jgi:hypothetical protein
MYELTTYYDPVLRCQVKWSTWRSGPAEVIPIFADKHTAYRPLQQRARDGTVVRHRNNRIPHRIDER